MKNRTNGGEGGIRTLGSVNYTRVPVVHHRPLGHLSINVLRGAEKEGFEPSVPFGTPDFESGTFDLSDTSPVLSRALRPFSSHVLHEKILGVRFYIPSPLRRKPHALGG